MDDINAVISRALALSGKSGIPGESRSLGGGEINNTYAFQLGSEELVLRIARYEDQSSLTREAHALGLLNISQVPKLVFFDATKRMHNRLWILESRAHGQAVERLTVAQFHNLGMLLAEVHQTKEEHTGLNVWQKFLGANGAFGNEEKILHHPDATLRRLITSAKAYFESRQSLFNEMIPALVHGDATPSNLLVEGDVVSLIDWEFSTFNDPMAEFSTIYYDDMDYNRGRWRVHISLDEREALYSGYQEAGGVIDSERIDLWMIFDKLGAALYLYWRLNESGRDSTDEQRAQYEFDLGNLTKSLEKTLA